MPKKETIQARAALKVGRFNDPLPADQQPPWREINGAVVVPRSAGDFEQRGPIIISGWMVRIPGSTEIEDTDDVMIRGEQYQIDGSVGDYGKVKIFYTIGVNVSPAVP